MAEVNKSRLDGWASKCFKILFPSQALTSRRDMHKSVGDTDGLEGLDDLLHGQTHRLALAQMLHGGSAHEQGNSGRNRGNHRLSGQILSSFHGPTTRSASTASGSSHPPPAQQSSRKTPQQRPNVPRATTGLDPALERNNVANGTRAPTAQVPIGRRASSKGLTPETYIVKKLTATLIRCAKCSNP